MAELAELDIKVNTEEIEKAIDVLNRLGNQAKDTEQKSKNLGDTAKKNESSFKNLTTALASTNTPLSGVAGKFNALESLTSKVGLGLGVTATAFGVLALAVGKAAYEYMNLETQMLKTNAVMQATDHAVGKTTEQLVQMSESMSRSSLFDDQEILSSLTRLATFTNLGAQNFDRAAQTALNLASIMDGDLAGAATRVGRALEDPINNLNVFARQGIQFSDSEKKKIQALVDGGKAAEAQALVLDRLNKSVQGVAQSAASGMAGAMHKAGVEIADMFKELGKNQALQDAFIGFFNFVAQAARDTTAAIEKINIALLQLYNLAKELPMGGGWDSAMQKTLATMSANKAKQTETVSGNTNPNLNKSAEYNATAKRIADMQYENDITKSLIEARKRLNDEAYTKTKDLLEAENEVRKEGLDLMSEEGQRLQNTVVEQKELNRELDRVTKQKEAFNNALESAGSAVGTAFTDAIIEGKNLSDVLNSLLKDLAKIALNAAFTSAFSGQSGGIFSFLGGMFGGVSGAAKGGVFAGGSMLEGYAKGGIVNRPKLFPMANGGTGLVGEGGRAEAVLPLTRLANGDLGVAAGGASSSSGGISMQNNFTFNIERTGDKEGDKDIAERIGKSVQENLKALVDDRIRNSTRSGNMLNPAVVM